MRLFLTQQMFEPILGKKVIEEGGDLRFSSELIEFRQDADGVTALVRNTETGKETLIRSMCELHFPSHFFQIRTTF